MDFSQWPSILRNEQDVSRDRRNYHDPTGNVEGIVGRGSLRTHQSISLADPIASARSQTRRALSAGPNSHSFSSQEGFTQEYVTRFSCRDHYLYAFVQTSTIPEDQDLRHWFLLPFFTPLDIAVSLHRRGDLGIASSRDITDVVGFHVCFLSKFLP